MTNPRLRYFSYYGCKKPERRRDNSPAAAKKKELKKELKSPFNTYI